MFVEQAVAASRTLQEQLIRLGGGSKGQVVEMGAGDICARRRRHSTSCSWIRHSAGALWSLHVSNQAMLSNREEGGKTLPIKILQKLMHMQHQRRLIGHCGLVAIEAINDHYTRTMIDIASLYAVRELAR